MKPLFLSMALAVTLTSPGICFAGGHADTSTLQIEEVTVMGQSSRTLGTSGYSNLEFISADESPGFPRSIAQILQQSPGIGFNGQGGLFQTVSIRGLSRQRVANFFLDIPILTERRAGTTSSFIEPRMLGEIEVLRGPASTYYGSGAMGGVLQYRPRRIDGIDAEFALGGSGDENLQYLAYGGDRGVLALSHRGSDDTKSSDGVPLHTGFDQYNGRVAFVSNLDTLQLSFDSLISYGEDIGKSNNRFPEDRVTEYPRERHWLGQVSVDSPRKFHSSVFFHVQDMETSVDKLDGEKTFGESESLDLGASAVFDLNSGSWPVRLGADYLARRNVKGGEIRQDQESQSGVFQDNLDAEQDQLGVFLDTQSTMSVYALAAGIRGSYADQSASGASRESDSALSGFLRGSLQLNERSAFSLELATGVRFPSLSERYFSGTTGRGVVIGNPDLDSESSTSVDLGFDSRWQKGELNARAYYMTIDDFIARVERGPELLSYLNVDDGNLYGAEFRALYSLSEPLSLSFSGQYLKGEDDQEEPLQDVPSSSLSSELSYQGGGWNCQLLYEYRFSKSDVAATEKAVDPHNLLSVNFAIQLNTDTTLSLWGRNLLMDDYWISTDRLSTRGEERSFGVSLRWTSER